MFRGLASKQIAVLNAGAAGLALAAVYVLVRNLTGRRDAALLASLLHLGSGFFLLLAVINEDIMPGYALVLWAMVLAAMHFDRPAPAAVIAVGILFTLGWLFEWRLMFPTLPALLAALALADIALKQRLAMAALLLVTMLAVAGLIALCWDGHTGAMGLPEIIWTGKGVASAWAGFSSEKLELLALGVGQYLIGARNVPVPTDDLATRLETWIAILLDSASLNSSARTSKPYLDRLLECAMFVVRGLRELPECLHEPHSAGPVDYLAAFPLPPLRRRHSLVRQYSVTQLDRSSRTLSFVQAKNFFSLSGGGTADRHAIRCLLFHVRPYLRIALRFASACSCCWPNFHRYRNRAPPREFTYPALYSVRPILHRNDRLRSEPRCRPASSAGIPGPHVVSFVDACLGALVGAGFFSWRGRSVTLCGSSTAWLRRYRAHGHGGSVPRMKLILLVIVAAPQLASSMSRC